jgi:hypothetical protein
MGGGLHSYRTHLEDKDVLNKSSITQSQIHDPENPSAANGLQRENIPVPFHLHVADCRPWVNSMDRAPSCRPRRPHRLRVLRGHEKPPAQGQDL